MNDNKFKGIRYHKQINLGKFLRLNLSKSGIGLSIGVRGLRYSRGPSGSFFTIGLPGTGLRYQKKVSNKKGLQYANLKKMVPGQEAEQKPDEEKKLALEKPGFFAPRWEKVLFESVEAYHNGDMTQALTALDDIATEPKNDLAIPLLFAFLLSKQGNDINLLKAISLLEMVVGTEVPFPTPAMEKYLSDIEVDIDITPQIEVSLPIINPLAAPLELVELYQETEHINEAVYLLQAIDEVIEEDPAEVEASHNQVVTLSLLELYFVSKNYQAIIDTVQPPEAAVNDIALGILFFYGRALQERNLHQAAIKVFNKCLRRKKGLSEELRGGCRLWRALSYLKTNKKAKARTELETVLAEAPTPELKQATRQALRIFWPDEFQDQNTANQPQLSA